MKKPRIAKELKDLPFKPIEDLEELQGNLKELTSREYSKLKKVLLEMGVIVPFFVWKETNKLLDGHQRKKVFLGEGWKMDVPVVYISAKTEEEARKKLLAISSQYGKISKRGFEDFTFDLDLDWVKDSTNFDALGDFFEDVVNFDLPQEPRKKRTLPLDAIYTLQGADCTCCLAVQAGWLYGIQSAHFRLCPYVGELSGRHLVQFIDNDYKDYNHETHLSVVKRFQPKYATVRDVMTEDQCISADIDYHPLETILTWAEELSEWASNVIVVPKYDCLDEIPEKFILGYSIPTSHGGTPLPTESFRGRRVHLLGGSWKKQLEFLHFFGDDVVSFDNNYILKQADYGSFCLGDGESVNLPYPVSNIRYASLGISVGTIGKKLSDLFEDKAEVGEVVWE